MKILILKRDKLGDLLLTTPMIQVLRQALPEAEIHLLASDYNAWVVKDLKEIDRLWVYCRTRIGKKRRWSAILQQAMQMLLLRKEQYDVLIVAQGGFSPRAIRRGLKVRAKRTIAYCTEERHKKALSDPLDPTLFPEQHEAEKMVHLLKPLGIEPPTSMPMPLYTLSDDAQDFAKSFLDQHELKRAQYVILGLGARRAKKQPSAEQIFGIAKYLWENHQLKTLFTWTPGKSDNPLYPGDDETAEPVLQANIPYIIPFRGSIPQALGLIGSAKTAIFPDSGLMHFAAASPGGVLGLFAETAISPSPKQWGPLGDNVAILEAEKQIADLPLLKFEAALAQLIETSHAK